MTERKDFMPRECLNIEVISQGFTSGPLSTNRTCSTVSVAHQDQKDCYYETCDKRDESDFMDISR